MASSLAFSTYAVAQSATATITGIVVDETGEPSPGTVLPGLTGTDCGSTHGGGDPTTVCRDPTAVCATVGTCERCGGPVGSARMGRSLPRKNSEVGPRIDSVGAELNPSSSG